MVNPEEVRDKAMTPLKNKGYIYKVTNITTGQFYIGQRSSYTGSPEDDFGVHYFTSSKVVRPLFKTRLITPFKFLIST